jgi:hypothetical protein
MKSVAEKRLAGCEGKERFPTFTLARRTAHRQAQKKKQRFMAYACQFCGGFHVGTHVGSDESVRGAPDSRQRYAVYAARDRERSTLVGYTNSADGGAVAKMVTEEGWRITNIVDRWKKAA